MLWSEELREMDRNTVRYMIDELQKEVDSQKVLLQEKDTALAEKDSVIAEKDTIIAEKDALIASLQSQNANV